MQRKNLTCKSQIEKGYYNVKERALRLEPICIHCGKMESGDFLFEQNELEKRCLTGGYTCFPICANCLNNGKKPVTSGRKNELKASEERLRKSNKV